jgi:hypothetical protein
MYTTPKFNYVTLDRENIDGERKYVIPTGHKIPSVTTILDKTKSQEKIIALENWKKRQGEERAKEITSIASSRGTRMHKFIEDYIKTGIIPESGSNPYGKQGHRMAKTIIENGLVNCNEYWGNEISLYYKNIYAGTTDLIGIHNNVPAIMDFKQSNKLKKKEWIEDYFLQLTAYAEAHDELYGTKIRKGVILMCTYEENIYQEFIIENDEFEYYKDKWFERVEKYYTQLL